MVVQKVWALPFLEDDLLNQSFLPTPRLLPRANMAWMGVVHDHTPVDDPLSYQFLPRLTQNDSGVDVKGFCELPKSRSSVFESLERFESRPSKITVSRSSSSCRCCTCEITLATVSEALVSCTKASSRFRVASLVHLLYKIKHSRFMIR